MFALPISDWLRAPSSTLGPPIVAFGIFEPPHAISPGSGREAMFGAPHLIGGGSLTCSASLMSRPRSSAASSIATTSPGRRRRASAAAEEGPKRMCARIAATTALLLAPAPSVGEPNWNVDHANSRLEFTVDIGGTVATGRFDDWSAEILFDPERSNDGRVRVEIDMGAVSVDDPRAQSIGDGAWLGVDAHPVAIFQSDRFDLAKDGALTVTGRLMLKGVEAPLSLIGVLDIDDLEARADLSGAVIRRAYQIGVGQDAVAAEVTVRAIVAARSDPKN